MKTPRIAFFINTPLRDTPAAVLTAFELCQQGATCYLVPQANGYQDILALAPDFVIFPYFRPHVAPRAEKYFEAGIQFGLLDTEGAIWSSMEEYASTLWKDNALSSKANVVCMWGCAMADYAINEDIFNERQIRVTGCPRFDFYSAPYSSIQENATRFDFLPEGKSILINTTFTSGNYADQTQDKFIEHYSKNFGNEKSEVRRWCEIDAKAVGEIVRMAGLLARDFPTINIIIRPHPQERIETYEERIDKLSNLHVIRSGAVSNWILRASAVIQRGCTTSVEASLAGVPAISPQWIDFPHLYPIPESVSVQCPDYDHLKSTLKSILAGDFQMPSDISTMLESLVRKWFYKIDGLSHKRVADAILNSLSSDMKPDRGKCLKLLYGLGKNGPNRRQTIGNVVRYGLRLSPDWTPRRMGHSLRTDAKDQTQKLTWIRDLVKGITSVRVDENPKPVTVLSGKESMAYRPIDYPGRTIVMECH